MHDEVALSDNPLAQLKLLHADLKRLLEELHGLTNRAVPDRGRLAAVRLGLSKASRKRTNLLHDKAYRLALRVADPGERARIAALQGEDAPRLQNSSDHINTWTLLQIEEDWVGYRTASFIVRTRMCERIAAEEQVLYRVLARAASLPQPAL